MPAANIADSLEDTRRMELLLLRSLSGLLLKWRDVVKMAQFSPVVAGHLFGTSVSSGNLQSPPVETGGKDSKRVVQQQLWGVSRSGEAPQNNAQLFTDNNTTTHAVASDTPKHAYRRGGSSIKEYSSSHSHCNPAASGATTVGYLVPPIGWIHELLARRRIIPNGASRHYTKQQEEQQQPKIISAEEEVLNDTLLGEIMDSIRVAFTGMNALQKVLVQQSETATIPDADVVETVARSRAGGESTSSSTANETMIMDCVMFFESEHRLFLETVVLFYGSLLRRVGHMMKEVLHELQGVKRGLRDSVELCALHKSHIRRLSTEMHVEEQMRMTSPCMACGVSPQHRAKSHSRIASSSRVNYDCSLSSRHSSPAIPRPPPRDRQCLLSRPQLKHGIDNFNSSVTDTHSGVYSVGKWEVSSGGGDDDEYVSNIFTTAPGPTSSPFSTQQLPPKHGPMYSEETFQRSRVGQGIKIPMPIHKDGAKWHRYVSRSSQSSETERSCDTSSVTPQRDFSQERTKCTYVVPRFGFVVEELDRPLNSHLNLRVAEVESGSPASMAGLAVGDVVAELIDDDASMRVITLECFLAWLMLRTPDSLRVKVMDKYGNGSNVKMTMHADYAL